MYRLVEFVRQNDGLAVALEATKVVMHWGSAQNVYRAAKNVTAVQ
jgi:hypothetical protein